MAKIEVRKGDPLPAKPNKEAYAALIEAYKAQNPEKYAQKEEALSRPTATTWPASAQTSASPFLRL